MLRQLTSGLPGSHRAHALPSVTQPRVHAVGGRHAGSSSTPALAAPHVFRQTAAAVRPLLHRRPDVRGKAHEAIPPPQGLFNPDNDRDACGVGFVGELDKKPTRKCVLDSLKM